MSRLQIITAEDVAGNLRWSDFVNAMRIGHDAPRPELGDQFLNRHEDTLLSRSAWIDGLGAGVKSVTVLPSNNTKGLPTVHGAMLVFENDTGCLRAVIDSSVITYWKTASDSVFGASILARLNSKNLLIIGAGVVAQSLVRAYYEIFPKLSSVQIYNRTPAKAIKLAEALNAEGFPTSAVTDVQHAAANADIISSATMSTDPVLKGKWVRPGTHVDLIGAFRPDMREADDQLLQMGKLFVDNRATTLEHIGELMIPLSSGAITHNDVLADLYDLVAGSKGRTTDNDITIFKNGGGAHLDLMAADVIIKAAESNK